MSGGPRKKLGEILIEQNILLPEQLEAALERQKQTGRRLGQVLMDMGFVGHDEIMNAVSEQFGIPHVWLRKGLVDPKVTKLIPKEKCQNFVIMPMFRIRHTLTLGMSNASDLFAIDDIESITGCKVQPVQCRVDDVKTAIRTYYS
ncbi:MAG: type II secretion system protein GspE, partial [Candidatus Hydrogenedentes bacterium]|nr:type II secretion system protein GspE [Candidatus Hydrogenedentota bacterium]